MEADQDGQYTIPVDIWTVCSYLFELTTGLKGVPQDRHRRQAIVALREKRLAGRIRYSYWWEIGYMLANALTKHDANDQALWGLLSEGWWSVER